ncbi:iron-containing alcohol dehydrogenase [Bifidobacterium pseudolongum]|uniref:iron-containing alcohol dehydrogenase n=1 Tax=Bifidobacterium pseudolongum TaxID=1694 RepID=UPI001F5C883F|nr:iron-containing alcohol dehydrogenase [Bifidobacterium pseudolongum]MDY3689133.1 iron-containing alcohol dehydrogenase [Bifidobacterium pseudolongum]
MATFNRVTDVHPGPNRYISEPGSAKNIERYLEDYAHPVIVTGELSAQAFLDYTGADGFFAPALRYDRSATERNARELAEQARALDADAIVAIGAGKLADTAKNVAELLNVDLVMVPTLACACAAYTPFSVNYDDEHRYVGSPLHGRNSVAMIVDSALISRAPATTTTSRCACSSTRSSDWPAPSAALAASAPACRAPTPCTTA